jgi:hypothetical protein
MPFAPAECVPVDRMSRSPFSSCTADVASLDIRLRRTFAELGVPDPLRDVTVIGLLVITISIVGFFFGADAARGKISSELGALVDSNAAEGVQSVIAHARSPASALLCANGARFGPWVRIDAPPAKKVSLDTLLLSRLEGGAGIRGRFSW